MDDPILARTLGEPAYRHLREDAELLAVAEARFEPARFRCGAVTPVYYGSGLNNFGVEPFLRALAALAPPPGPRMSSRGLIAPDRGEFSGFIFKIQANMDPLHRDRMAFVRICSGRFEKDMLVHHPRLNRTVRLARPHRLFAADREIIDEAFPGDVVGLVNPGLFAIGDTLCAGEPFRFEAIPRFQPESFAVLHTHGLDRYKQFHKGLAQLEEEGAMQPLVAEDGPGREPILAAVGELQFDVVRARLAVEYGVETTLERLAFTSARWLDGDPDVVAAMRRPSRSTFRARDREGRPVALFASEWERGQCEENPGIAFRTLE